jgi:c-di-GMP-binding flagellar brake protein YcgR
MIFSFLSPKDLFLSTDNKVMSEPIQTLQSEQGACQDQFVNKRRHLRSTFTYPVEFKIFTQNPLSLKGVLRDISQGGSCLEFDDPYKRLIFQEALQSTLKLTLSISGFEKKFVLAKIQWIRNVEDTSMVKLGIEFKDVTMDQIELIDKLLGMRNKDHNMLWNLWEEYQN